MRDSLCLYLLHAFICKLCTCILNYYIVYYCVVYKICPFPSNVLNDNQVNLSQK